MKHIIKYSFICLVASFAMTSCQGFLDENPATQVSSSVAYNTEETLEAQITGIYGTFHAWGLYLTNMQEFCQCASTLLVPKGERKDPQWRDQFKFTKYSTSEEGNYLVWKAIWPGVNRCNRLIDNLPDSPVDEAYKKEIEAEAKLLRAIFYFDIVRFWGDAPLFLSSPTEINDVNTPRQPFYKIYNQILVDLDFAEANMRTRQRQEQINFERDRMSRYAATAFKASVFLTIGSLLSAPADDQFWNSANDANLISEGKAPRTPEFIYQGKKIGSAEDAFKLAMENADRVIESGDYALADDYRQLFRWTNHEDFHLSEAIFRIPLSQNSGNSANIVTWINAPFPEGTANFEMANGNYARTRPSRWGVNNFIARTGGKLGTGTNNKTIYATTSDPRYHASIRDSYMSQYTGTATTYEYVKGQVVTYPINDSYINNTNGIYYLPYIWKYVSPDYNVSVGNCGYYFMRLAEMYLISAEAAVHLGQPDKAIQRVNTLRRRAASSTDTGFDAAIYASLEWKDIQFSSDEELLLAVWWERYIEMSFEGHEYFDTHRYGATWLAENIAIPHNEFLADPCHAKYVAYLWPNLGSDKPYIEDPKELRKSLLFAYPQKEFETNPRTPGYPTATGQNDFYWQ